MNWRIWYINNLIVDGTTEEDWANAPATGVLAIAAYFGRDEYNRKLGGVWSGSDWYWMVNGEIYQNSDSTDEPNYWLPNPAPEGSVSKQGKWTTNEEMETIHTQQINWIS